MTTLVVVFLLFTAFGLPSAQTGVCYRSVSSTEYYQAYWTHQTSYTYGCGWWSSRCRGTRYYIRVETRTRAVYHVQFGCCDGYQQDETQEDCLPICSACDSNHICIAPNTCECPQGWRGNDCSEDIDECSESSPCEQNCSNNIGSYSCSCDMEYSLATDMRSCLGPPRYVNMGTISATSLHVYWTAPELDSWDGDIIGYRLTCSSTFGFNLIDVVPSGRPDYTLNSLRPFSNYTCCVLASTTNGPSSSSCATQETLQDRPADFPHNITVDTGSAFALYIEWDPPLIPNGIITSYTIYASYDNGSEAILSVNSSIKSYRLGGLSPHQTVYISISASTVAGEGRLSNEVAYRTSQAVPSAVTNLEVHPLSPYTLQVLWDNPHFPNGVITGFEITVYNEALGLNSTVAVGPDVNKVNISENIEPFIPYTVKIRAFTHIGGGVSEKKIAFSQEAVPNRNPIIYALNRTSALTAQVMWELLSLLELRGFSINYIVKYSEQDERLCPEFPPDTSKTVYMEGDSALLTHLDPSMEYCVYIAASTAVGVGTYSQGHIPLFTYILFQIHFHDVHHCLQWRDNNAQEKVLELTDELTSEWSNFCDCDIPANHIADGVLLCDDKSYRKVIFQGRLVLPEDRNASELEKVLTEWVTTNPRLSILGVQLEVDETCPIILSDTGDMECTETDDVPPTGTIVGSVVGLFFLMAVSAFIAVSIALYYYKRKITNDKGLLQKEDGEERTDDQGLLQNEGGERTNDQGLLQNEDGERTNDQGLLQNEDGERTNDQGLLQNEDGGERTDDKGRSRSEDGGER